MSKEQQKVALYSNVHRGHVPPYEIWNGEKDKHQEVPARAENILEALRASKIFELQELNEQVAQGLLEEVHDPAYLAFLAAASESLQPQEYRYPSVFALRDSESVPTNQLPLQDYHSFDMYTPVSGTTYDAAVSSASLAWKIAEGLVDKKFPVGYALCRPPGHHAEKSQMGGYCYINNAAVAAQYLSEHGKVATLYVDFHHGNGTQHIFYDRPDVMTVSLHADPQWKFPHMSGFEDEQGKGEGLGLNRNYALQQGTSDEVFQSALERACERISTFDPQYLVVSFGADTFVGDPIGGFALTSEYFTRMGRTIDGLSVPTAIVQEGGYNTAELGTNVVNFLAGFK